MKPFRQWRVTVACPKRRFHLHERVREVLSADRDRMQGVPLAFFEQLPIKKARRVVIGIIGGTVLLLGVALLVLPGPAFIVIPTGLAILATEFVWAKHLLRHIRDRMRWQRGTNGPPESPTQCETDQHHRR